MRLTGRHFRILALGVLVAAVLVIVLLPGPASGCRMVSPGIDPIRDCPARDSLLTPARLVTGAVGIVIALGLWLTAAIRETT